MTSKSTQIALISIFSFSLAFCYGVCVVVIFNNIIYEESLGPLLKHFTILYSVPFATIIAGVIAKRRSKPKNPPPSHVTLLAISFAVIWNVLVLILILLFALGITERLETVYNQYEDIMPSSTFLLAGALTYFFAKE